MPRQPDIGRAGAAGPHPVSAADAVRHPLESARGPIRLLIVLALLVGAACVAAGERDAIRLRSAPADGGAAVEFPSTEAAATLAGPRRGFDYDAFEARLESLWFQRKALLAEGRDADAEQQARLIRAFCSEEGVRRLEHLSDALLIEAQRFRREGRFGAALSSLELARGFDPDRPQVDLATAVVLWESGRSRLGAAAHALSAARATLARAAEDLSLFQALPLLLVVAVLATLVVFSVLMVLRHHAPLRHEVEEWVTHAADGRWAPAAGWAVLLLPLVLWFGAAWAPVYWLVVTFRHMTRAERWVGALLLVALGLAAPGYRLAVSIYGATADPVVRTTLAAAGGEYSPDRIVRLRRLIDARPDDPVYHFLLAGLYKNGRYFEEAFDQYKQALTLDPSLAAAHVNVGNIFHATGQYAEAVASYRRALETAPTSLVALFDLHLAQSEAFRFTEAEESLNKARAIDPRGLARLFIEARRGGERATVVDATLGTASLWQAALGGMRVDGAASAGADLDGRSLRRELLNPLALAALLALVGCVASLWLGMRHGAAHGCVRCGRPFCQYCKSGRDGHEYCSQCVHLFVLGDGLAPETKRIKLYEVERYERRRRRARSLAALILPGSGQLLLGQALRGALLIVLWLAALIACAPSALGPLEAWIGVESGVEILQPRPVPAPFGVGAVALLGAGLLVAIWVAGQGWRFGRREA